MPEEIGRGTRVYVDYGGDIELGTALTRPDEDGYVIVRLFGYGRIRRHVSQITLKPERNLPMNNFKLTKPAIVTGIALIIGAILGLIVTGNYNSLVSGKAEVDNSWAKVETQYQRRLDLIGNLVSSVKGAQTQEQKVFGQIADARKQYDAATSTSDKAAAASQIETNITAIVPRLQEAYPDLKSNAQVQSLMNDLRGTEDTISKARDGYNNTTKNYNINVKSFPKNIFAGMFGYKEQSLFKADIGASTAPKVQL